MSRDGIPRETRIVVRAYGSSIPLAFFSFGIGMLMLGGQGIGWLAPSDQHTVGIVLAAFVFPLETTATIFALLARDTFSATGFGLFSSSWLTVGLTDLATAPGQTSPAVGLYLLGFAAAIGLLGLAAFAGKPLVAAILLAATARGALDGAYQLGAPHWAYTAGGWIAFAIFLAALYGGLAFLLEDERKQPVLPVFRRGTSSEAMEGGLSDQLRQLGDEAGVRQTL